MRTLIVEDDFLNRFIIQKMLIPYGPCDIAVNGEEAIRAFEISVNEGMPYDLICMDIMMPEMDGKTALLNIRQKEKEMQVKPSAEVKVAMITALDAPADVVESFYKCGCSTYLVKPIERHKIKEMLKELELL